MSGIVSKNAGRASGIVGAGDVGADAVDGSNIADDAIDSEHYADGSIDNAHIADDAIDSEHYTDGSIDNAHIADDAIDSEHYTDGSIDNAHIADDAIDSEHYADGSIDEAHIADNAVTLAKMAGGTDGNIISFDASGDPVAIATGSDGEVLTSAGAGAPPAFEAAPAGGLVFLASATASSSAAIEFTSGITSTYSIYLFMLKNIRPATNAQDFYFQFSADGGSSWLVGNYGACAGYDAGVNLRSAGFAGASYVTLADSVGNGTGIGVSGPLYLIDPNPSATHPQVRWDFAAISSIGSNYPMGQSGGGSRNTSSTVDAVRFSYASGDIADGEIRMYGIKDS